MWSVETSCGFESKKIKYLLPKYTRGRVLEVGCGTEKAFAHFIGYDSGHHFGKGAADIIGDAADLSLFADESFDAVFSSHVLEHMVDMQAALNEWARVIKPGGYLCLYVPSANLYPKCGEPGANPDHKHDIDFDTLADLFDFSNCKWDQIEFEERNQDNEYSYFAVFQKLEGDVFASGTNIRNVHQHFAQLVESAISTGKDIFDPTIQPTSTKTKTACVCRFGGFGDMLQTALIFPRLKEQGYHVTVMTTPQGQNVIKHDPNVDDWYIVDTDQVPNQELGAFWAEQAKRFDRFINLSESIEGTLLAMPGRINHSWPQAVRAKRMNSNYHEWTADLARVAFKQCQLFYGTAEERLKVEGLKPEASFTVLWALAGSSIHKFTPHMDAVIARIMLDMPEAHVLLVGDDACRLLEQGWENEQRVHCLSGTLSIRETLALAQLVNLVIGPETGVLNAVGMDKTPHKVLLLSHSSANNLSKHWENTQALTPVDCACYPCHRLHYSTEFCSVDDETGAAECAIKILPGVMYAAVEKVYKNWKRGTL